MRDDYDELGGAAWDGWPADLGAYVAFVAFMAAAGGTMIGMCVAFVCGLSRWEHVVVMLGVTAFGLFLVGFAVVDVGRDFRVRLECRRVLAAQIANRQRSGE